MCQLAQPAGSPKLRAIGYPECPEFARVSPPTGRSAALHESKFSIAFKGIRAQPLLGSDTEDREIQVPMADAAAITRGTESPAYRRSRRSSDTAPFMSASRGGRLPDSAVRSRLLIAVVDSNTKPTTATVSTGREIR